VGVLPARHAEGRHLGVLERQLANGLEILRVLGVGQGITALDEIDTEIIKLLRDEQLVLQGEIEPLATWRAAKPQFSARNSASRPVPPGY
jgi:hypothetical protein